MQSIVSVRVYSKPQWRIRYRYAPSPVSLISAPDPGGCTHRRKQGPRPDAHVRREDDSLANCQAFRMAERLLGQIAWRLLVHSCELLCERTSWDTPGQPDSFCRRTA